jgi:hypothetical protein
MQPIISVFKEGDLVTIDMSAEKAAVASEQWHLLSGKIVRIASNGIATVRLDHPYMNRQLVYFYLHNLVKLCE